MKKLFSLALIIASNLSAYSWNDNYAFGCSTINRMINDDFYIRGTIMPDYNGGFYINMSSY